jgi:RNA polymerase sigma factor (sigma-70 family)
LCRDKSIAEEVTQETFLKALKNIDNFQGKCKIAKNTLYTYQSKQARMSSRTTNQNSWSIDEPASSLDDVVIRKEDVLRVHRVLHNMKEPYKEVFTLRVFGELSFGEISGLFGKTESWARVTFYRAKQSIQHQLKEGASHD